MGGLTAALRLGQAGWVVEVLEARDEAGGLAGGLEIDGLPFDAGPYILLDRQGLEWSYSELGLDLAEHLDLRPIAEVYEVTAPRSQPVQRAQTVRFADLARRDARPASKSPGRAAPPPTGASWSETERVYRRLAPLQRRRGPVSSGCSRPARCAKLPFLLRSLG